MIPLPLRDDTPTYRFPLVTLLLIVANVIVWLLELTYPQQLDLPHFGGRVAAATLDYGAIPQWILQGRRDGIILLPDAQLHLHQEVPWPFSIVTSMFMHGGFLHIIGNMWFLWIFGDNLEDAMGRVRYVGYYLLCGVVAALAQIFATPHSVVPMVGASGAVAGVLGGYVLLYPHARVKCLWFLVIFVTTVELPAYLLLGLWFLSQFLIPSESGIAWMAHVGGFLAGLGFVRLFLRSRPLRPRRIFVG